MAKLSTRKFDAIKGGDYQEPPVEGHNMLLGSDSAGPEDWSPHYIDRPLHVEGSGGEANTNPQDIKQVPETDVQSAPEQLDR